MKRKKNECDKLCTDREGIGSKTKLPEERSVKNERENVWARLMNEFHRTRITRMESEHSTIETSVPV